ncbi:hypothetical protein WIC_01335 [Escherichia coli KTE112]|nr:hypothetical protein A13W_00512 [Escherichia coli KTE193]ELI31510.1 hypothetical protein WIC_01335 [Escherichia coli KTE112]
MKKFALLAGLFVFAPMTWAQDYNIKNGLPSETYITCAEANEMAKTDSAQVAEIVAVMGNASVASRDLKIEQSPELSAKVVEKLNQVCASLFRILCKYLFSEVAVQAVTELDNKAAHCHTPVPQWHRPFL